MYIYVYLCVFMCSYLNKSIGWRGRSAALPPQTPHPQVLEGLRPSNSPSKVFIPPSPPRGGTVQGRGRTTTTTQDLCPSPVNVRRDEMSPVGINPPSDIISRIYIYTYI